MADAGIAGTAESPWPHGVTLSGALEAHTWRARYRQLTGVGYRIPLAPELRFEGLRALVAFAIGDEDVRVGADRVEVGAYPVDAAREGIAMLVDASDPARVRGVLRILPAADGAGAARWSLEVAWRRQFREIGTGALELAEAG